MNDTQVNQTLRTLRIVVVAMAMGVVGFGIVAFVVVKAGTVRPQPELVMLLPLAVGGVAFIAFAVGTALRRTVRERLRRDLRGGPVSAHSRDAASGELRNSTIGEVPNLARGETRDATGGEVPDPAIGAFSTLTLISGALAEGPSLFGVLAFLVTSNWLALVVPLLGLLVLWGLLPSRSRLDLFVADVTDQHV